MRRLQSFNLAVTVLILFACVVRADENSGFSYQGELRQNEVAVTGDFDFRFQLWSHPTSSDAQYKVGPELKFETCSAGAPECDCTGPAPPNCQPAIHVVAGNLQNVELDFETGQFVYGRFTV